MKETSAEKPARYCIECGTPIGPSRGDKKYCTDDCRIAYNNERRKNTKPQPKTDPIAELGEQREFKRIYEILLKNREILHYYYAYMGDTIQLRDLLGKGFNLKYFTSVFPDESNFEHRCCFDYAYHINEDDKVYIVYLYTEIH